MNIDKNNYQNILNTISNYSKEEISQEELEKFKIHVEEKLNKFKPTLMLYGTYNAGKSMLINAFFGKEEMAKTGNSPETSEVIPYTYKGFTIYDTPGINAPIEHEKVTKEHLKKSEVILFVISNKGSFEDKYIYNKISEIVKINKPILIVLNNKTAINIDSEEAIKQINKVNENLSKIGDRNGIKNIEKKVLLCMVNAKSAVKAKIENKKILLKKSNILQLEAMTLELLTNSGSMEVMNTLDLYIKEFVEKIIFKIDKKIKNPELQKIEELLTYLEKFKQKSEIELKNIIYNETSLIENGLREKLLNRSSEVEIHHYIEEHINTITHKLDKKFQKISDELKQKIEQFEEEMHEISIKYGAITSSSKDSVDNDSLYMEDSIKKSLKNKELVKKVTKEALLKLRKLKILFKGKWGKTLDKYAGRFAIVVNVLVGVYEIYQAFKKHNEEIERKRQHVLSATNTSKEFVNNLKNEMENSIDEILDSIFSKLIESFKEVSKELNIDNSNLLTRKEKLQKLKIRGSKPFISPHF